MSDGPYKSLPMSRSWRNAAKAAYHAAFDNAEVCSLMVSALQADVRSELSAGFRNDVLAVLQSDDQLTLFPEQRIADLEVLQPKCSSPMDELFLRAAVQSVNDGFVGEAVNEAAFQETFMERCVRGVRQVEEHFFREGSQEEARFIRHRMTASMQSINFARMAQEMVRPKSRSLRISSSKQQGLDDGVNL